MNHDDVIPPWRKSSYSNTGANCVEVAKTRSEGRGTRLQESRGRGAELQPGRVAGLCCEGSDHGL